MSRSISFATEREGDCVYVLENGAQVRMRIVLMGVADHGRRDPNGLPIYELRPQLLNEVIFPDDMVAEAKQYAQPEGPV